MTNQPASQQTFTIGALGDSISVAFNAEREGNNEAHSWSTGNLDLSHGASHFRRLQRFFPAMDVRAANYAVSGARAADLRGQVDQLLAHTPDYVTLLMGANDLARCGWRASMGSCWTSSWTIPAVR